VGDVGTVLDAGNEGAGTSMNVGLKVADHSSSAAGEAVLLLRSLAPHRPGPVTHGP